MPFVLGFCGFIVTQTVQVKEARKQLDAAKKATEKNVAMHDQVTRLEEARAAAAQERDASFDTLATAAAQP
jgi:hypothetical protein